MREIRQSGSEGGEAEDNRPFLPLSEEGWLMVAWSIDRAGRGDRH